MFGRKAVRVAGLLTSGLLHAVSVPLTGLVPRRDDFWLFGHRDRLFAGNSRYLFLWMSLYRPDIRVAWIAEDEKTRRQIAGSGFEVYRKRSIRGIMAVLRARVFVFCHGLPDVSTHLSGGAYLLNLWHGIGIKATMFGDKTGPMAQRHARWSDHPVGKFLFFEDLKRPDALAATSDFTQSHFAVQFDMPAERCPQLGYPRLDTILDEGVRAESIRVDATQGFVFDPDGFSKVILYMPTWRDTGRPFLSSALPDMARLSASLRATGSLLYIKAHPWTREVFETTYDNIRVWPNEIETLTYFDRIDALVTDYSSALYDYLFHRNAGIVLYTFDLAAYLAQDRQILYPFEENTAGLRVTTFDDLCAAIGTGRVFDECDGVERLRTKFWGDRLAPASPGVVSHVETALLSGRRASRVRRTADLVRRRRSIPRRSLLSQGGKTRG